MGDIVQSREHDDRRELRGHLQRALEVTNTVGQWRQPLAESVGDEVQGVASSTDHAVVATLVLQLHLLPHVQMRFGMGWGQIDEIDRTRTPYLQDGPAWWAARSAVDRARTDANKWSYIRSRFELAMTSDAVTSDMAVFATGSRGQSTSSVAGQASPATLNAFLTLRDQVVMSLGDRAVRVLRLLLAGAKQSEITRLQGVTRSATSQMVGHNQLAMLADTTIEMLPDALPFSSQYDRREWA